jgi:fatty-acyl-CoA synthase
VDIWRTLERAAGLYPRKLAVIDGEARLTYAEVRARAAALARFFQSRGVDAGDRISILHSNAHEFLEAYYAAAGLGAILNPLNVRLAACEIAAILRDAGARWLVSEGEFAPMVEAALAEGTPLEGILWTREPSERSSALTSEDYEAALSGTVGEFEPGLVPPDRVAHLYYTSGTTGQPKGVMLTHRNVCTHALGTIAELRLADTDVWGHIAPMFHLADAWATFAITWAGGRHVMLPRFDPGEALALLARERVTITNVIPTMLNRMVHHPGARDFELSSLRTVLSGGAPIAPELVRRVIDTFGCDYVQTYGLTETSPYLTFSLLKEHLRHLPPEERLAYQAKTGRPFLCVELRIVDLDGQQVAADGQQVGEIEVRGETVTPGYWNQPEETARAFRSEHPQGGSWLRTGDLATLDAEGYVNIVDRKKDMILTGGENVYSTEVENVLHAYPKVLEAVVFGVPDAEWGEAVKAAVALHPGETAAEAEIIAFCRERLAAYKAPKSVDFLPELPRTGSGKITKRVLRDPYWAGRERRIA